MGVSLERVQYKFASIIGELCSEPLVLSQFAVWLDLRLAEYKSKGSISLDCLGTLPEPDWLKGLSIPTAQTEKSSLSDPTHSGDLGDSFFLLAKETNSPGHENLRLSYPGTQEQYANQRRVSDHRPHLNRPAERNRGSEVTVPSPDVVVIPEEEDDSVTAMVSPALTHAHHREPQKNHTYAKNSTMSSHTDQSPRLEAEGRRTYLTSLYHYSRPSHRYSPYKTNTTNDNENKKRISTERNIATAVSNFHRWLKEEPRCDSREMEKIPGPELDTYLADFFSVVKKPSGEDYTRRSFSVYRYSLDRYLKEHGYPLLICWSDDFAKSQQSFQRRKLSLPEVATDQLRFNPPQYSAASFIQSERTYSSMPSQFPTLNLQSATASSVHAANLTSSQTSRSDLTVARDAVNRNEVVQVKCENVEEDAVALATVLRHDGNTVGTEQSGNRLEQSSEQRLQGRSSNKSQTSVEQKKTDQQLEGSLSEQPLERDFPPEGIDQVKFGSNSNADSEPKSDDLNLR